MIGWLLGIAGRLRERAERWRIARFHRLLRARGMHIGRDVWLPASTWIDADHCYLISIEDHCGLGEQCMLLAHDAQMDEFLDAGRLGRVRLRESCHIGARTVILPGVELGPRTIVGANSVVSRSLPADTVCAGNPAQVVCTLEEYLAKHRQRLAEVPIFRYEDYSIQALTPERRVELVAACERGHAYMVGGRAAEMRGEGGTPRTDA